MTLASAAGLFGVSDATRSEVCPPSHLLALPARACRHTSRFIIVYLTFLPFALWPYVKWLL